MARMKVLLMKDVPDLGEAGEVYAVAGGYARNYLMPRGMAVLATRCCPFTWWCRRSWPVALSLIHI